MRALTPLSVHRQAAELSTAQGRLTGLQGEMASQQAASEEARSVLQQELRGVQVCCCASAGLPCALQLEEWRSQVAEDNQ